MMLKWTLVWCAWMQAAIILLSLAAALWEVRVAEGVRPPSYRTFEDYLQHLDKDVQSSLMRFSGGEEQQKQQQREEEQVVNSRKNGAWNVDDNDNEEDESFQHPTLTPGNEVPSEGGQGAATTTTTTLKPPDKSTDGGGDDDDDRRRTCCVLGELAGDKGFHCFAEFYAARIVLRNVNRAHNKKLGFYGRFRIPAYGERIMKTFEQCVLDGPRLFHRCCQRATLERSAAPSKRRKGTGSGSGFRKS